MRKVISVTFETDEYESKDEAVFAILDAIRGYESEVDPRPIRWIDDSLISEGN